MIVTWGHRYGAVCLRQVLEADPKYLRIDWLKTSKRRVKNLMELLVCGGIMDVMIELYPSMKLRNDELKNIFAKKVLDE